MINDFTQYQIFGLKKLASYRKKFYGYDALHLTPRQHFLSKQKLIEEFTDIFCEHNFADTDYSAIQQEPLEFDSMEAWIQQASISSILKCFTYFIWTDKIVEGYFSGRVDNFIVEKLLLRLEEAIMEENLVV